MLPFEAARALVIETLRSRAGVPESRFATAETIDLPRDPRAAIGRILAQDVAADRDYPPFNRSTRDGYAMRSASVAEPGTRLRLVGESRAGVAYPGTIAAGECVRILTGAPLPRGADTVVMQELTQTEGEFVLFEQAARTGQHYVLAGAEARAGEVVIPPGTRLGYAELAVAAEVGQARLKVTRRPRVAIVSTGDELVALDARPGPFQIRNSNGVSLAAHVALVGSEPVLSASAHDEPAELRASIERGLEADLLLLSGGVSVGKYDLVEQTLLDLGAEILFDSVAIRPGRPTVFAWCRGKPVFGLPGNPVSTMVTFELFVAPAIELLSGYLPRPLPLFPAQLAHPIHEKGGMAHFLPARVTWAAAPSDRERAPLTTPVVETLLWEGSGDIGAVARGNCFLLVRESRPQLEAGEWAAVLPRRGVL